MAVDIAPEKLALAASLGATDTLNSAKVDVVEEILRLTRGVGADHAFEAVGLAATVALAIRSVRKGGAVTLVGNVTPQVEFPLQTVVTRELSLFGSCASRGVWGVSGHDEPGSHRSQTGPERGGAAGRRGRVVRLAAIAKNPGY